MHFSLSSEFLAFFQKDSQLSSTWTTVYSMLIVQNVKKSVFFFKGKKETGDLGGFPPSLCNRYIFKNTGKVNIFLVSKHHNGFYMPPVLEVSF